MVEDNGYVIERRAPLTERHIEMMLGVLIRKESAFLVARSRLQAETFAEGHRRYAILWSIVDDHYEEFNELPLENHVVAELEVRLDEDPGALSPEGIELLDEYLAMIYRVDEEELKEKVVFRYLKQYLEDRLAERLRSEVNGSRHTPSNLFGLMSTYAEEASSIGTLEPVPLAAPFERGWDRTSSLKVHKVRTWVDDLDDMMQGGTANGEVFGILGPHGSCKTTLGVQIAAQWSANYREAWKARGRQGPLEFVYMFIYEGSLDEMRLRALSHIGQIARDSLEIGDPRALSREGQLHTYEERRFSVELSRGERVFGELERYRIAQRMLNDNFRIVDMTGNDSEHPGRGAGMVDEIRSTIETDGEHHRRAGFEYKVGGIVVDYVGAAVERFIDQSQKASHDNLRHLIGRFPLHSKNKLARSFDCPVCLLHQLSGTANSFAPGKVPKGTDSAECKSFRENLDHNFVVGNPSSEDWAILSLDKHRRGPAMPPVAISIDGRFSTVRSTNGAVVIHNNKLVEAASLRQYAMNPMQSREDEAYSTLPGTDSGADNQTAVVRGNRPGFFGES